MSRDFFKGAACFLQEKPVSSSGRMGGDDDDGDGTHRALQTTKPPKIGLFVVIFKKTFTE